MDLRYSAADEAFRHEARRSSTPRSRPTARRLRATGEARRAYDTGWQRAAVRTAATRLGNWPVEFGGRGLPSSQQPRVLRGVRGFRRLMSASTSSVPHTPGPRSSPREREQQAFHLPLSCGARASGRASPSWRRAPDLASLRTRRRATATTTSSPARRSGRPGPTSPTTASCWCAPTPTHPGTRGISWLILDMRSPGVDVRPIRAIDGERHFCEMFLDEVHIPVADRVGDENDGWRVTNVTLRFGAGTAPAQHIITLRSQLRRPVDLARRQGRWDDPRLRRRMGRTTRASTVSGR
ncbi:MAG: hypothetical protein R2695_11280 [Acidimicrobiales bacterium]